MGISRLIHRYRKHPAPAESGTAQGDFKFQKKKISPEPKIHFFASSDEAQNDFLSVRSPFAGVVILWIESYKWRTLTDLSEHKRVRNRK